MKAEIIQEHGFEKYFAIKISDLPKRINGSSTISFRVGQCEYSNDVDMVSIFNEIIDRINKGENK